MIAEQLEKRKKKVNLWKARASSLERVIVASSLLLLTSPLLHSFLSSSSLLSPVPFLSTSLLFFPGSWLPLRILAVAAGVAGRGTGTKKKACARAGEVSRSKVGRSGGERRNALGVGKES
eukprot:480449-Hanusia_phi.AAC.3